MDERISLSQEGGGTNVMFGDRKLAIYNGCVMSLTADALVCPVDPALSVRGGLARIVLDAAGTEPREERPLLNEPYGNVVVLPGGKLKAKYIFLSVLLGAKGKDKMESSIREAVDRSIRYAEFLRLKSIAFPLLGSAVNAPPYELVARNMLQEVAQYLGRRKPRLKMVLFSINNAEAYSAFNREARSLAGK